MATVAAAVASTPGSPLGRLPHAGEKSLAETDVRGEQVSARQPYWYYPRSLFDAPDVPDKPGGSIPQEFTQQEVEQFYLDDTQARLSPPGQALLGRLHDELIGDRVRPAYEPVLYLTGGIPGAGKSTVLHELSRTRRDMIVIDPDAIKTLIVQDLAERNPDLRPEILHEPAWGSVVHWTSSVIAQSLLKEAVESGRDIAFDSSMACDDQDRYRRFTDLGCKNQYRVNAVVTHVDPDVAVRRASERSQTPIPLQLKDGSTLDLPGRQVPTSLIHETHGYLIQNVETYQAEGLYDQMTLLENNVDGQLARVTSCQVRSRGDHGNYTSRPLQEVHEQIPIFVDPTAPEQIPELMR